MTNTIPFESFQVLLVHPPRFIDVACALGTFYAILRVVQITRRRLKATALRGPPSPSFLWGVSKELLASPDPGAYHEKWVGEYGCAYEIPLALGGKGIALCDPKAVAHFYARETLTYILTPFGKIATENVVSGYLSKGFLIGEIHRRLRKTLTPAFSNAAIRDLTPVFYDSAYKVKGIWDSLIESSGGGSAVIEVQKWMNHTSLDTIGIAGFSHDFGSLDGKPTSVTDVFDTFGSGGSSVNHMLLVALAQAIPLLLKLPTPHLKLVKRLNDTIGAISNALLTKSRKEKAAGTFGEREEKSILGLLIRSEDQGGMLHLTPEEVTGQAKVLLLAGYETTSISLTWALIELSRHPDIQTKLRTELLEFGTDPTFDQLPNNLPYLDAVIHETLRLHAPLRDSFRMAAEDDIIPLSKPIRTRTGKLVDHISIAKGTHLTVSISYMNRSNLLWGPDAREFKPERWIGEQGIPATAREIQGHRHLLTFIDGPRTCLGKGFAITEFKVVLSVLVRNFIFEFPSGPETAIETKLGILPRPKVAGEEGTAVPLRVRRFE